MKRKEWDRQRYFAKLFIDCLIFIFFPIFVHSTQILLFIRQPTIEYEYSIPTTHATMSCAGRHHMAKRSEATRDFTDTNWDGSFDEQRERIAVVECDTGNGFLKIHNIPSAADVAVTSTTTSSSSAASDENSSSFLVSLPGKFHKLIWFLRGDIIVHDSETCIRKVSDEQLTRLAREKPAVWEAALRMFNSRREDTLLSEEQRQLMLERKELAANKEENTDAKLKREQAQALRGNPNRASYRVATGFTSSDDDDAEQNDDGEEEQEEHEKEEGEEEANE